MHPSQDDTTTIGNRVTRQTLLPFADSVGERSQAQPKLMLGPIQQCSTILVQSTLKPIQPNCLAFQSFIECVCASLKSCAQTYNTHGVSEYNCYKQTHKQNAKHVSNFVYTQNAYMDDCTKPNTQCGTTRKHQAHSHEHERMSTLSIITSVRIETNLLATPNKLCAKLKTTHARNKSEN